MGLATLSELDFCAYGTPWRKRAWLAGTLPGLKSLARRCSCYARCSFSGPPHVTLDGKYSKGQWRTLLAQPYPERLCFDIANLLLLSSLERAVRPYGPDQWDEGVLLGLRPTTITLYRKSLAGFYDWLQAKGLDPLYPQDWEKYVVHYGKENNLSRSHFARLLSAVERFHPSCRRKLAFARDRMALWRRAVPSKHTSLVQECSSCDGMAGGSR